MDKQQFSSAYAAVKTGCTHTLCGNGVGFYSFPELSSVSCAEHYFSARTGGVSTGFLSSLNLSFTRGFEPREQTMQNYQIFCDTVGIPSSSMIMDTYEHGTVIRRVDRQDCGAGYTLPSLPPCDGLITDDPEVTLVTGHADCMAFYAVDPVRRCIGLAHAGWRGALHRIGKNLIESMVREYGSDPMDIRTAVGPSICPDCFEVGIDVAELFTEAFPYTDCRKEGKPGKAYIDLWKVAAAQFMEAGILPEHVIIGRICTVEDHRLYSHRGEHGQTGGMAAFLRLKTQI